MKNYKIDQYFEFTFNTQRFDTGAATDADSTPTYRVYEENNDTVIDSGNCSKRDDSNTTGYYYVRAQCTTALGYEVGKTYEVRIAATVNSVAGAGVVGRFAMIPVNVWDSLYGGTDVLDANAAQISEDATAADNLETMLDGTGGQTLTMGQLRINSSSANGAIDIDNSGGPGIDTRGTIGVYARASGASNYAIEAVGAGATDSGGIKASATTAGEGFEGVAAGNGHGAYLIGAGSGEGLHATAGGGANGHGGHFEGVGANSHGLLLSRGGSGGDDLAFQNNDVTVATVTTVTNLTNAPSSGDFTSTMKTSLNNATPSVTVSDKTGFSLSAAGIQAIWDALSSALTTVGSIGKRLVDYLTGDIFARIGLPAGASVSVDIAAVKSDSGAIKTKTDYLPSAAAGAAGGLFIAGSNAATTVDISGTITTVTNLTNLPASAATAAELAKVPKSDSNVTWNATALASINAEVDTALNTPIPGSPTADSINERIVAIDAYGTPPTAVAISDAVWDEALSGHTGVGSSGSALSAAGSAGDPWATALPGAYGSGTAGKIIGDRIDATISSRGTGTALDAAGIRSAVGLSSANLDTQIGDIPTVSEFNARTIASANYALDSTVAKSAELDKVPKSDGSSSWNATALAAINTQCDTALSDVGVTTTVTGRIDAAISSRGTGTALDATGVRAALGMASANLDTQLADIPTVSEMNARTIVSANYALDATVAKSAELDKVPKSDGTLTFNATATAALKTVFKEIGFTDTIPELSVGAPSATPTMAQALMLLYMAMRNETTETAETGVIEIKNNAGTTICKSTITDDNTTLTKTELISG